MPKKVFEKCWRVRRIGQPPVPMSAPAMPCLDALRGVWAGGHRERFDVLHDSAIGTVERADGGSDEPQNSVTNFSTVSKTAFVKW